MIAFWVVANVLAAIIGIGILLSVRFIGRRIDEVCKQADADYAHLRHECAALARRLDELESIVWRGFNVPGRCVTCKHNETDVDELPCADCEGDLWEAKS